MMMVTIITIIICQTLHDEERIFAPCIEYNGKVIIGLINSRRQ